MKIYRRIGFIAVLLVAVIVLALITENIMPVSRIASANEETNKKIILDAGHAELPNTTD